MIKAVLVVDDDPETLLTLKEGLEKGPDRFAVSIAGDGVIALEKLRRETVSLVVADLAMPRMDGFELITHVCEDYPDIPVIAISDRPGADEQRRAERAGAVACLAKPFVIDQLARLIREALQREADGGILHGVSSGMLLQLIEMEEKTCTVRMTDLVSGKAGVLFFRNGQLLDSRSEGLRGLEAAYRIFSWDQVDVAIQNACGQTRNVINSETQPIMLEAMRRKDEGLSDPEPSPLQDDFLIDEVELIEIDPTPETSAVQRRRRIADDLAAALGEGAEVGPIRTDTAWEPLLRRAENVGAFLSLGDFRAGYIVSEHGKEIVMLGGEEPLVMDVPPRCQRDRLMRLLGGMNL